VSPIYWTSTGACIVPLPCSTKSRQRNDESYEARTVTLPHNRANRFRLPRSRSSWNTSTMPSSAALILGPAGLVNFAANSIRILANAALSIRWLPATVEPPLPRILPRTATCAIGCSNSAASPPGRRSPPPERLDFDPISAPARIFRATLATSASSKQ